MLVDLHIKPVLIKGYLGDGGMKFLEIKIARTHIWLELCSYSTGPGHDVPETICK